jgi:hypothetical protein
MTSWCFSISVPEPLGGQLHRVERGHLQASASRAAAATASPPEATGSLLLGQRAGHRLGLGEEREGSLHRALEQHPGHQHPVDLVRPLEDPVDASVSVRALHRVLLDEAGATVDLHRVVHQLAEGLAAHDLHDGRLDGELLEGGDGPRLVAGAAAWLARSASMTPLVR